jgi:hypothetical protein
MAPPHVMATRSRTRPIRVPLEAIDCSCKFLDASNDLVVLVKCLVGILSERQKKGNGFIQESLWNRDKLVGIFG